MEAVGFAISVASVISALQTGLDAYKSLNTALAMGDTAVEMILRFRVEEMRLRLWGRSRGISFNEGDGTDDTATADSSPSFSSGEGDRARPVHVRGDVILEIPQMRRLLLDILARILAVLEKQSQVTEKYDALKTASSFRESEDAATSPNLSIDQISVVKEAQGAQSRGISKGTRFAAKIRWAVRDKQALTDLLAELTALNDGLENLLPRDDAAILSQSLTAEVINAEPSLRNVTSESFGVMSHKAAAAIELRRKNMTNMSEKASPFSNAPISDIDTDSKHMIPMTCFPDFVQPRLKYQQTSGKDNYKVILEVPSVQSLYNYIPLPNTASKSPETEHPQQPEVVLIEWRSQEAESKLSMISGEALARRRGHIVSLLSRTATSDDNYRVLNCLGFCLALGRLPDGETHPIVGFIYRLPTNAARNVEPVSLRAMLGEAFISEDPLIPNLDDRYLLAKSLATSLYHLHCAGWIHRKISSYNILFFEDKTSGHINLSQPYLCGWQYARPDFRTPAHVRQNNASEKSTFGIGDLDMYVHPDRLDREKGIPRFRQSYDIYSLGIVLIEIAFWEPIVAFASVKDRAEMESFEVYVNKTRQWSKDIRAAAEKELGPEMGLAYRNAVLTCLGGLKTANRKNLTVETDDMKDMEVGIVREFFWKVVDKLKRVQAVD